MNKRLKEIRLALGLSQEKFARPLQLTQPYYALLESGKRPIIDKTIARVAARYGANADYLRTGRGPLFAAPSESSAKEDGESDAQKLVNFAVSALLQLSPEYRAVIAQICETFLAAGKRVRVVDKRRAGAGNEDAGDAGAGNEDAGNEESERGAKDETDDATRLAADLTAVAARLAQYAARKNDRNDRNDRGDEDASTRNEDADA